MYDPSVTVRVQFTTWHLRPSVVYTWPQDQSMVQSDSSSAVRRGELVPTLLDLHGGDLIQGDADDHLVQREGRAGDPAAGLYPHEAQGATGALGQRAPRSA